MYNHIMDPIVVHANWYQFRAGERIRNSPVGSRAFLYCKTGHGQAKVNSETFDLEPEGFLFLPWNHDITYLPDREDPFFVGAVHIVPDYEGAAIYYVPHSRNDLFAGVPNRRDAKIPHVEGVLVGDFGSLPRLFQLAEYTVERFNPGPRISPHSEEAVREESARMLAALFLEELSQFAASGVARAQPAHPAWTSMRAFVRKHLAEDLRIADIAAAGGASPATATRVFRAAAGCSPARYLQRMRMERAESLIRTTSLGLGEIGARVGINDPYHFSKLFKKIKGIPPSSVRKGSPPL